MKQYRSHILVSCVLAVALLAGMHHVLQRALTDMRFGWFPRQATGTIVLVAIDSRSIDQIGVWPWPRQHHADLTYKLIDAGVTDIVFDVDFSSASTPTADDTFVQALRKAGGSVVLPAFKQWTTRASGKTIHINRPLLQFEMHTWSAIVNVAVEPDGLVRRYSFGETLDGQFVPSIGALLAGKFDDKAEPLRIDYSIRPETLPTVSYLDVLRGDPATLQKLKGKKVVIGAQAIELGDRFSVPNGHVVSGPELQILAAESILQGRALHVTSSIVMFAGLALLALLMVMLRRRSAGVRVTVLAALAITAELGAMLLQAKFAIILQTALWHVAIAAYLAALALDEIDFRGLLSGIAERRFQRIAMSLSDGLVCTDQRGLITVWNPGAEAIFGHRSTDMLGQPLHRICSQSGATVPFAIQELRFGAQEAGGQEVGGQVLELEGRRKNGEVFPLEASFSKWEGVDGHQYGAVMRDISDRKREAERVRYLAEHDTLTDLANRHAMYEHLNAALATAAAEQSKVALLVLDLDKFKQINDTYGHSCGDQVLCDVAQRLRGLADGVGFVARLSGDEFAIVVRGADTTDRAGKLAERLSLAFNKMACFVGDRELRVNVSVGIAIYPDYGATADELFGNADLALYRAKAAGRGRHVFFERTIRHEVETRLSMEAELARAIENREFELFYQPQVELKDGKLAGAEALIRWRHPLRGLMLPASFMPLVNTSALANRIAPWVLETVCRQGRRWQQQGHALRLGVNLSPSQLQTGDLAKSIATVLADTGFSPSLLEIEVTENILLEDDDVAREMFRRIQDLGVRVAFDDFGTGYASLTYLKKFHLDGLKIDKSFVQELRADTDDAAIVGYTIGLGQLLGMRVIAEGIESAATADMLKAMGCNEGQGYHFGAPMPAAEFERRYLAIAAESKEMKAAATAA